MAARKKVKPGEGFVLRDGSIVETKAQLATALAKMPDDEFESFCNTSKNDFYVWLRDCLDAELAERVRGIGGRTELVKALKAK